MFDWLKPKQHEGKTMSGDLDVSDWTLRMHDIAEEVAEQWVERRIMPVLLDMQERQKKMWEHMSNRRR